MRKWLNVLENHKMHAPIGRYMRLSRNRINVSAERRPQYLSAYFSDDVKWNCHDAKPLLPYIGAACLRARCDTARLKSIIWLLVIVAVAAVSVANASTVPTQGPLRGCELVVVVGAHNALKPIISQSRHHTQYHSSISRFETIFLSFFFFPDFVFVFLQQ